MMPSVIFVFVAMFGAVLALLDWMLFSPPFDEHLGRQFSCQIWVLGS
jgi:hypothetical protein